MIPPYLTVARLAWRQYVAHFDLVLFSHLIFSLPMIILGVYLKAPFSLPAEPQQLSDYFPNLAIVIGVDYVTTLLTVIVSVVIILGVQQSLQRSTAQFSFVLAKAWPLYVSAMIVSLAELVCTFIGLSLLIVPGIVVSILFSFALVSLVWYHNRPMQAIKHSIAMVWNSFSVILLYMLTTQLLLTVILFIFALALPTGIAFTIFGSFVSTIIATYLVVFQAVLFTMTPGSVLGKQKSDS